MPLDDDKTPASPRPQLSSFLSEPPGRFLQQSSLTDPPSSGSSYLSLPLLDLDLENPPYRTGTNDSDRLDMENRQKRKIKRRRQNKELASARRNIGSFASHLESIRKAQNEQSFKQRSRKSDDESSRSCSDGSVLPSTPMETERLSHRAKNNYFECGELEDPEELKGTLFSNERGKQSLAGTNRGPILSLTTASAVRSVDRKASAGSSPEIPVRTPMHNTKPYRRSRAYRDENRRRRSMRAQKYDTPAIITLRKASSILVPIKRRPTNRGTRRVSDAMRHSIVNQEPGNIPQEMSRSRETNFSRTSIGAAQHSLESYVPKHDSPPFSSPLVTNRSNTTVDLSLVSAEVLSATSEDSTAQKSRKHSTLAIDTMRRMSKAHSLPKSASVEVIWNRDDCSSSISSSDWIDFDLNAHSSEPGSSSDSGSANPLQSRSKFGFKALYLDSPSPLPPILTATDSSVPDPVQIPSSLLQWSWDRQDTAEQMSGSRELHADTNDRVLGEPI